MNKSRLQELVLSLLEQGKEGEYWDFKQEWHEKIEDLLKDIICFANTVHSKDCYIIFGVADDLTVTGMKKDRRKQADIIDALSKLKFAGDIYPKIELTTIDIDYKDVDILRIFDVEKTPIYLKENYGQMRPGCIYTRAVSYTHLDVYKRQISRHIKNIYEEGELVREATVANFATVQNEGDRQVERNIEYYNLDVIISVGYRVKSKRGVQFRIWATNLIKEYMKKGFVLDDERLKELGGGGYFKELLERIRDIRASEKVFYRQILEIYATSIDYDPKADVSIQFFKKVQNKIHYAIHGETAAEVIYHRADAEKEFMGLTTFSGNHPTLKEAKIAKNYLNEKEMKAMGQLVSGYLDFAERQAEREQIMTMEDWVKHLDNILTVTGEQLLVGNGSVTHQKAMEKAETEYKKYKAKTLSDVEKDYLDAIKELGNLK